MLKYILIWLCIGYVLTAIKFYVDFKFDVNNFFDWFEEYLDRNGTSSKYDIIFQTIKSSEKHRQIFVGTVVILETIIWPIMIPDLIRTFKRKLR